jgi:hypothetical protein
MALLWGLIFEGAVPDIYDTICGIVTIVGIGIIFYAPRRGGNRCGRNSVDIARPQYNPTTRDLITKIIMTWLLLLAINPVTGWFYHPFVFWLDKIINHENY